MEEKFDLKQNSFYVFIYNYGLWIILGAILGLILKPFEIIPKLVSYFIHAGFFITAIVFSIKALKNNNSFLVISDKNINLCRYNKNQKYVYQQFNNVNIEKITAPKEEKSGEYQIKLSGNKFSKLKISSTLKPDCITLLKINTVLYKIFDDRFVSKDLSDIKEYHQTGKIPTKLTEQNQSTQNRIMTNSIIITILSIIPTILGILAIIILFLKLILQILYMLKSVSG